ncbi:hypothetical protein QYF61_013468 [Mycteria americana]|uniref:Uncharacterized protein n=1 Tax=Mycteria americana TaxID=33587 RepID=A0AAN7NNI3_MYCAM|nr:hypothetical protein QYF61_013468 [Mycteria americana]
MEVGAVPMTVCCGREASGCELEPSSHGHLNWLQGSSAPPPQRLWSNHCKGWGQVEETKLATDKAKQPQLPQPLLISLVLQTLPQLRCPSLDTLQPLNVSLVVGGPKLNTGFEFHSPAYSEATQQNGEARSHLICSQEEQQARKSYRLEKTFKIIESNHKPNTAKTTTTPCP